MNTASILQGIKKKDFLNNIPFAQESSPAIEKWDLIKLGIHLPGDVYPEYIKNQKIIRVKKEIQLKDELWI